MTLRLRPIELTAIDKLAVDAYAIFVGHDERPLQGFAGMLDWRLAAAISRQLGAAFLSGEPGESFLMTTGGLLPGRRLFAFGLGPLAAVTPERFSAAARRATAVLLRAQVASLAIGLPDRPPAAAAAPLLAAALSPLASLDVSLFGPLAELSRALPELAGSASQPRG